MTIKTRLIVSAAITIGLTIALIILLIIQAGRFAENAHTDTVARELTRGISELVILTNDYLTYQYPRIEEQWHTKYDAIKRLSSIEFPSQAALLSDLDLLKHQFLQIKKYHEELTFLEEQNASQRKMAPYISVIYRFSTHINQTAQKILLQAFQLSNASQEKVFAIQQRNNMVVLVFLALMLIIVAINIRSTFRRIHYPFEELAERARRIRDGDFTSGFEHDTRNSVIHYDDEIGTLALAFNNMTQELISSLEKLKTENAERKKTEAELKISEKKYRSLVEFAQEGIWVIDKDSYTIFANPSMSRMLGYDVGEMEGKHLFSFMDEGGIEKAKQNLESRKRGITEQHDFEFLRKDGQRIIATMETAPIIDENGNYDGAIAGVLDITKRVDAENALRKMNIELDKRVQDRTGQLNAIVKSMSGREVRMAELKTVITRLRTQLKEAGMTPIANDPLLDLNEERQPFK